MSRHAAPIPPSEGLGLVGDVGGTNARFALAEFEAGRPVLHASLALRAADYPSMETAVAAYLASVGVPARLKGAVIACAGPVMQGRVSFINQPWSVEETTLGAALGAPVRLINDLAAGAWAAPALSRDQLRPVGPPRPAPPGEPLAVIGVGTGFNASTWVHASGVETVLVGESGHVGFAPWDEVEVEIWRRLTARFGRTSVERVLSGPGLLNVYAALAEIEGAPCACAAPEEVSYLAAAGDALARAATARFCAILGGVAGDVALSFGARGGLFIAGGVAAGLLPELEGGEFLRRFEAKGRFQAYLAAVPVHVILDPHAALLGAARAMIALGVAA